MLLVFIFQLKGIGRVALTEESDYGFTFFYHIAHYMESLVDVIDEEKSAKAREEVISCIARDEKNFTKVNISFLTKNSLCNINDNDNNSFLYIIC